MGYRDQMDKVHEQLIKEEGINKADLPLDIKKKIKGWNVTFARLDDNKDDEKLFNSLQRTSIEIADKIQDFIEQDIEEKEASKSDDSKDNKKPESIDNSESSDEKPKKEDKSNSNSDSDKDKKEDKSKKDDKSSTDKGGNQDDKPKPSTDPKPESKSNSKEDEEEEDEKSKKPKGFGNLVMKKKIMDEINSSDDQRIRISTLKSIIGKEPDHPEQKVHDIVLRKVFLSSTYRLK